MPRFPQQAGSTEGLSDRVFSALLPRIKAHKGVLHPLHVGDTYLTPPKVAWAQEQRMVDRPDMHKYAPVQGEPVLLAAIARRLKRRFGADVAPDCLQVMSGATAGVGVVVNTVLNPGDEVLLLTPYWPLIRGIIQARGAVPVQVPVYTRLADPTFDLAAELTAHITDKTVAIYLNTPNNPSGASLSADELGALASVAKRFDLWVISDEVYEDLYLGDEPPACAWTREDLKDRTIVTHSLSKAYGLAGARLGFTHGPPDVMKSIRGVQTFVTYCASRPMQLAGARAVEEGEAWLANARRVYREAAWRVSTELGLPMPEGGTFFFFDAAPYLGGASDCMGLLEECIDEGVILVPGVASGSDYATWVRLCFTSVPLDDLSDALTRLRRVFDGRLGSTSRL
jgi:N-succinyldiaminopimelate aminotransferase